MLSATLSLKKSSTTHHPAAVVENASLEEKAISKKSIGVRKAELMAAQYNSPALLVILYTSVWICGFTYGLDQNIRGTFLTNATNSYRQHSLLATVNVLKSVMNAAALPTYARLSDMFGRLELIMVALTFYVVGTIIQSQAYDIERFAAGNVLYSVGVAGIIILMEVTMADTSPMRWRLVAMFVPATPYIIHTWISGDVAASLLKRHLWSYCIGIWAFIMPLASIPLLACLLHMRIKAMKTPEWRELVEEEKEVNRDATRLQLIKAKAVHTFWKIDVIGLFLVILTIGLILVPFTIAGGEKRKWQRASTIVPLVLGFCIMPVFVFYEKLYAKYPLIPFPLLKDRGVWSALVIAIFVNWLYYMPSDYLYTVLVVGMKASVRRATRITSLYSFVTVLSGPLVGLGVYLFKRTKAFVLFGIALWFVGFGLLIYYKGSNDGVDYQKFQNGVIGGMVVLGLGCGFYDYTARLSLQACTNHEFMAVVIGLFLAIYNIGAAIGFSISGAMWTQLMFKEIQKQMAFEGVTNATLTAIAYQAPLTLVQEAPWGSPPRKAIVRAYASIQKKMCIVAIILCVPLFLVAFFLRDHELGYTQSIEEDNKDGQVVVNTKDNDPILKYLRKIFSGKKA